MAENKGALLLQQGGRPPPQDAHASICCCPAFFLPALGATALTGLVVAAMAGIGRSMSEGCASPCMVALGYQGCLGAGETLAIASLLFTVPAAAIAVRRPLPTAIVLTVHYITNAFQHVSSMAQIGQCIIEIGRRRAFFHGVVLSLLLLGGAAACMGLLSRRRDSHSADTPCASILKRLQKGERVSAK